MPSLEGLHSFAPVPCCSPSFIFSLIMASAELKEEPKGGITSSCVRVVYKVRPLS